jgi:N-acetylmuramoyl-L-alanine amidase
MALFCVLPGLARAAGVRPAVTHIGLTPAAGDVRLVIDATKPLSINTFFLKGEKPRFVIDLPAVRWAFPAAEARVRFGLAEGVRYAHRDGAHSRMVVDLADDGALVAQKRTPIAGGWRYAFTLRPLHAEAAEPAAPIVQAAFHPALAYTLPARKVVVIDAGHGGKDPGASSPGGRREKDITLAAALALKAELERRGGYDVVLTRSADTFVPLPERVRIAREARADLFISLHADSSDSPSAAGASIYTLSESGTTRAKGLMDRQDWQLDLGAAAPRSDTVEDVLVDLTQRETKSISAAFADELADHLSTASPLLRRAHRNAGYYVLLAPDVPAVLVEMGFLTHAADVARLTSPQARGAMMAAIADSIDEHFTPVTNRSYAEAGAMPASFGLRGAP